MRLYEIDGAILDVIESGYSVDEETGEILFSPDDLENLSALRDKKLEACAMYAKNLQAEADAIKAERDRLDARLKAKQRKAEKMRAYITMSMQALNEKSFETATVDMCIRRTVYVDVFGVDALPPEYVRRKVTELPDKMALKKALIAGEHIPGAMLAERPSLTIR